MDMSDLLFKKHKLLLKIKKIAETQEQFLQDDKVYDFLDLSAQRTNLSNEIDVNDRKHEEKAKKSIMPKDKGKLADISSEIITTIKSIQEIDERIETLLVNQKSDLALEIKNYRKGKKAVHGYGGKGNTKSQKRSKFIDRQG